MKKAFTLAEVLITLTIIGVIAAITIPNLMQSYKKNEVEVRLKAAYSILQNATKMAMAEKGINSFSELYETVIASDTNSNNYGGIFFRIIWSHI